MSLLSTLFRIKIQVCMSTQFGHTGDGYGGTTPTIFHGRPVQSGDYGIAHRRWPIGSTVVVENLRTRRWSLAQVIDRGPYGKTSPEGKWFNAAPRSKDRDQQGVWRGCADLTPDLAKAIDHDGKDRVKLTLLRKRHGTAWN